MDERAGKLPPQSIEAEQAVLGAILIDTDSILKALEVVQEDDFYRASHRKIYRVMLDLFDRSEAIDLITVSEELKNRNELDDAGGSTYLSQMATNIPTAANILYHAKIVREKSVLRAVLRSATEIAEKVYEDASPADDLLDFAEKTIFDISDRRTRDTFTPMSKLVKESFEMIEKLHEKKDSLTGVASGFDDLDNLTTGFQKGDLIIIGGRPSMGKTAFALNIAQHVGAELHETVALFSLEMSKRQLVIRMLCSEAMVDSHALRKGFIPKDKWVPLTDAVSKFGQAPIYIDDTADIGVLEMRAKARRLKKERGTLSLVIVDYLQLMRGRSGMERREQEISEISRSLKALAKELDVPVIALSQLNRKVVERDDKRPTLANLRESGAIEQDADVIIFIHREEMYEPRDPSKKGKAEIIVAKQRNGPTDTVRATYISKATKFVNYTEGYGSEVEVQDMEEFE